MKIKELKQKTDKELIHLLNDSKFKLGQLNFDKTSKKIKNFNQINDMRRTIAQILTLLKQREQNNESGN